jgi:hypothetical protein
MLDDINEQIRNCLEHAEECARKAAGQPAGSPLRQDFLDLEKSWLVLARSIEQTERLVTLSTNTLKPNGARFRKS